MQHTQYVVVCWLYNASLQYNRSNYMKAVSICQITAGKTTSVCSFF